MVESALGVTAENTTEFGPWMVIERRPPRNLNENCKTAAKNPISDEGGLDLGHYFWG